MKVRIFCPRCKKTLSEFWTEKRTNRKSEKPGKVCDECKKRNSEIRSKVMSNVNKSSLMRQKNSKRMLSQNPAKSESVRKKISETLKQRYSEGELSSPFSDPEVIKNRKIYHPTSEDRRKMSNRMIENNPMKNPEVVQKVRTTIQEKIKKGELQYKRGRDHHLWRGGSDFYTFTRLKLYPVWVKPILERDQYSCTECGKSNCELHVHHIRRFVDIMKDVLRLNQISRDDIDSLKEENYQLFDRLSNMVVDAHRLDDGKTVCQKCHQKIDYYYRRRNS
jgi:hypothetical protein